MTKLQSEIILRKSNHQTNWVSICMWSLLRWIIPFKAVRKGSRSPRREPKVKGLVQEIEGDRE